MRRKHFFMIIILNCLFLFAFELPIDVENVKSYPSTTYPINGWMTATPEEVGINSTKLEKTYQYILDHEELGIDSVSIVKNGYLCYKKYFEFFNYSNIHNTYSITKSVTSALIGIANSTGMITNLDEPVVEIFSNRTIQNLDARKEAMTIRHLLEMRSGLEWNELAVPYWREVIPSDNYILRTNTTNAYPGTWLNYYNPENDFPRQLNSTDWIQYILDKPMVAEPGAMFTYSTGVAHLLSAILREKTGLNPEVFAKQYLFDPLNITEYLWWKDPSGLSVGGAGLWLTPNDMLKIGYLYLKNGEWNNTQILPETWIESSKDLISNLGFGYGYGYQWWINNEYTYYFALGLGGQIILVKPDRDLVVAITAWESIEDEVLQSLINVHLLKAFIGEDTSTPVTTTAATPSSTSSINSLSLILGMILLYSLRKKRKT
ncbi:MAG: serine hydrolase domain-containing protein [Candidatus Thorarchaeota archaeon]